MPLTKRLLIPLAAALAVFAMAAPSAFASTTQVSIVQDNNNLLANPPQFLQRLKSMGVTEVKFAVYWNQYVPSAKSTKAPAGFKASSASAYSAAMFKSLDTIDVDAAKDGITLGLMVTTPAPRWAEGTAGCSSSSVSAGTCDVNVADYENFIKALGSRYNGTFSSSVGKLPKVKWWSFINEPNYIPNLAPQFSGTTYSGADKYRQLLNAAWVGLRATGHAGNTFLFGELAPRGISGTAPANGAGVKPVAFLSALYCETTAGKRLTGKLASENDCSSSGAAFKKANPALFDATGVSDHPYGQGISPTTKTGDCTLPGQGKTFCIASGSRKADPLWTDLASISDLENGLAKDLKAYGSSKKYPIWSTEYGYWTSPPGKNACHSATEDNCDLSQTKAAEYLNQAEYVSYKNPRIASFDQYQLFDPTIPPWTDGLLTTAGAAKPAFAAWELPFFMPTTSVKKASNLTVWGDARPCGYYKLTYGIAPKVLIQIQPHGTGAWQTLKTVSISNARGYFSTTANFATSGNVRLIYAVSPNIVFASRTQAITVK